MILVLLFSTLLTLLPVFQADTATNNSLVHLENKKTEALAFCKQKGFNQHFCVLVDMSIHSGKKRLFIWDFSGDSLLLSCLVGHGCCDNNWGADDSKDAPKFSNIPNSHCSSLGKYKIGERAYSDWGIHIKYLLHGLESTNSNALSRYIVLHAWEQVTDDEIYPSGTSEGWGCPTVSNNAMRKIDALLKEEKLPTLFWIYNQ